MGRSDIEIAADAAQDARKELMRQLPLSCWKDADIDALLDALDNYILARVNLIKADY
jgi:hypothetical protein